MIRKCRCAIFLAICFVLIFGTSITVQAEGVELDSTEEIITEEAIVAEATSEEAVAAETTDEEAEAEAEATSKEAVAAETTDEEAEAEAEATSKEAVAAEIADEEAEAEATNEETVATETTNEEAEAEATNEDTIVTGANETIESIKSAPAPKELPFLEQYHVDEYGDPYTGWKTHEDINYYIYEGYVVKDAFIYIDDQLYRFDENGLFIQGWYEDANGDRYYFDADGSGYDGWLEEDGKRYYIDGGYMCAGITLIYDENWDGTYWNFDSNGRLIEASGWYQDEYGDWYYFNADGSGYDGWLKSGDKWYYISNGRMCTGVIYIDGKYWNFDSNGRLIEASGWYQDEYGDWYYFNADGSGYDGWLEEDGKRYYIDNGRVRTGIAWIYDYDAEDGNHWNFGSNGSLVEQAGWYQNDDSDWYYFNADGSGYDGWLRYGDKWYYISNGRMCTEIIYIDGKYWNFDSNGRLIEASGWYEDANGDRYYFDADGSGHDGWLEEDGKRYYIDNGRVRTGIAWIYDYDAWYGNHWNFDNNGRLIEEAGWYEDANGDRYYFNADGSGHDGWLEEDGKRYYIDRGCMCAGITLIYDENWDGTYWNFDNNGRLIEEAGWYQDEYGDWYYFNADGSGYDGWLEEDGKRYYIDNGRVRTGKALIYDYDAGDGNHWNFDNNGRLIEEAGWYDDEYGGWYYFNADGSGYDGWLRSGDKWYYIDKGYMRTGVIYIDGKYWNFDNNGRLIEASGWYQDESGDWYYFNADGSGYDGWLRSGDKWYYISNGRMRTGVIYIDGKYWCFDSNGRLIKKTGWYKDDNGDWYYFNADSSGYDGWLRSGGKWYYIDGGRMCTGVAYVEETCWRFDSNGRLIEEAGWYKNEYGDWYYFNAGGFGRNGWLKSGDKWYYISNGRMCMGITWLYENRWFWYGTHWNFGGDGRLIEASGWYQDDNGDRYYFNADGSGYDGWLEEGDKRYYIDNGRMSAGATWVYDDDNGYGTYWHLNDDGELVEEGGWYEDDEYGYRYYFDADGSGYDGWLEEGDKRYYIDNGRMSAGATWVYDDDNGYGTYWHLNDDGELVEEGGWYEDDEYGYRYYFNADGSGYDGWLEEGDKRYYIDQGYVSCERTAEQNGWYEDEDGTRYYFEADSRWTYHGWLDDGGKRYYIHDGRMCTGITLIYDNNWEGTYWRFGSNGSLVEQAGWYQNDDGDWYYFNADGSGYDGWLRSGDKWYYIDKGYMRTGAIYVGSIRWYFDNNGRLVEQAGWRQDKYGDWYYFNADGSGYDGWLRSGSKWYYIDRGNMRSGVTVINDKCWRFDSNGRLIEQAGWHRGENSDWYYFNANGSGYHGWLRSGDKWHYINEGHMCTGATEINGKYWRFDSNGHLIEQAGWYRERYGSHYYFNANGSGYHGWLKDDGKWYFIDAGRMLTGITKINGKYWRFDSNGQLVERSGWYEYSYEDWKVLFYFKADGSGYDGWLEENSKLYYIDQGWALSASSIYHRLHSFYVIDGQLRQFDYDGVYLGTVKGWVKEVYPYNPKISNWHYANSDGSVYTGWLRQNNKWYYIHEDGLMATGRVTVGANTYIFNSSGSLANGWAKIQEFYDEGYGLYCSHEDLYYANSNGTAYHGWLKYNNKWYYFDNGLMVKYAHTINGISYKFDKDGVWIS